MMFIPRGIFYDKLRPQMLSVVPTANASLRQVDVLKALLLCSPYYLFITVSRLDFFHYLLKFNYFNEKRKTCINRNIYKSGNLRNQTNM